MNNLSPAVGASGVYVLTTPFETRPATTYTCKAIRSFDDIYRLNEDVFQLYYEPFGLTEGDFQTDVEAGAVIVTLMANEIGLELSPSDPATIIYVPNTYIDKFPDGNAVPYSHFVISASLGSLPDYLDISDTMNDVGNIISDKIGVTPEVNLHKALTSGVMTQEDHAIAETGREAAIVNRNTIYSQWFELNNLYNSLLGQYTDLEAAYIAMSGSNTDNVEYLQSIGYFRIDLTNAAVADTVYVDAMFFNQVKFVMDLTTYGVGSYVAISGTNPLNGATGDVDGDGNLVFDIARLDIVSPSVAFVIKVYDVDDIEVDSFTVTFIYVNTGVDQIFADTTLTFDLTLAGPHVQRLYFSDFARRQRVLLDELVIVDPWDPDEIYYELAGTAPGITFVYGKNFIEFTVDEGFYPGVVDTTVDIDFIRRTTDVLGANTDLLKTFSLHITNA